MVFRKLTVDNSVRYIPKSEQIKERYIKSKTIEDGSFPRKQQNFSQNNKKFFDNVAAQGFSILK